MIRWSSSSSCSNCRKVRQIIIIKILSLFIENFSIIEIIIIIIIVWSMMVNHWNVIDIINEYWKKFNEHHHQWRFPWSLDLQWSLLLTLEIIRSSHSSIHQQTRQIPPQSNKQTKKSPSSKTIQLRQMPAAPWGWSLMRTWTAVLPRDHRSQQKQSGAIYPEKLDSTPFRHVISEPFVNTTRRGEKCEWNLKWSSKQASPWCKMNPQSTCWQRWREKKS